MSDSTVRTFSSFLPILTHLIARLSQKETSFVYQDKRGFSVCLKDS